MPNKHYKKPTLSEFNAAIEKTGGNLSDTARLLGVRRQTIWNWAKEDEEFADAISASRKQMLDQCISTARMVALGVPIRENGKFVGWEVPPDSNMLRYLMSTLGRDEDFGESMTIRHTADEGIDVSRWIEREVELKKQQSKAVSGD